MKTKKPMKKSEIEALKALILKEHRGTELGNKVLALIEDRNRLQFEIDRLTFNHRQKIEALMVPMRMLKEENASLREKFNLTAAEVVQQTRENLQRSGTH